MGSGTNNGVRPQCCSLTPLLGSDPVAVGLELRGKRSGQTGSLNLNVVHKTYADGRPMGSGRTHTQPKPKPVSFR
jgi:hypothetical protein